MPTSSILDRFPGLHDLVDSMLQILVPPVRNLYIMSCYHLCPEESPSSTQAYAQTAWPDAPGRREVCRQSRSRCPFFVAVLSAPHSHNSQVWHGIGIHTGFNVFLISTSRDPPLSAIMGGAASGSWAIGEPQSPQNQRQTALPESAVPFHFLSGPFTVNLSLGTTQTRAAQQNGG